MYVYTFILCINIFLLSPPFEKFLRLIHVYHIYFFQDEWSLLTYCWLIKDPPRFKTSQLQTSTGSSKLYKHATAKIAPVPVNPVVVAKPLENRKRRPVLCQFNKNERCVLLVIFDTFMDRIFIKFKHFHNDLTP